MSRSAEDTIGGPNCAAFLDMIAWSEIGPELLAESDDGYNLIVGSVPGHPHLFSSYADHPRVYVHINERLTSSAAGRYQILARYFDFYKDKLGLRDFSPESQDKIAFQDIKECHALAPIQDGAFAEAVLLCSHRWASLPGNSYGQRVNTLASLQQSYQAAGGRLA